jgi:hypothetical protein
VGWSKYCAWLDKAAGMADAARMATRMARRMGLISYI